MATFPSVKELSERVDHQRRENERAIESATKKAESLDRGANRATREIERTVEELEQAGVIKP